MNKRGGALSLIIWTTSIIVCVFFLAGMLYFSGVLTNTLLNVNSDTPQANLTYATQSVLVPVNASFNGLVWISYIILFCTAFAILIESFYIREHPIVFFFHMIIMILAIVISIYISDYYQSFIASNNILAPTLKQFVVTNLIISYLPYWVAIIGTFGLILLGINISRDPELKVRGGL